MVLTQTGRWLSSGGIYLILMGGCFRMQTLHPCIPESSRFTCSRTLIPIPPVVHVKLFAAETSASGSGIWILFSFCRIFLTFQIDLSKTLSKKGKRSALPQLFFSSSSAVCPTSEGAQSSCNNSLGGEQRFCILACLMADVDF